MKRLHMRTNIAFLRYWKKEGKKIAIYCAGTHGKYFSIILRMLGIETDFFLDNDKKKWNTLIEGKICYAPALWSGREDVLVFICVGMAYYFEVLKNAEQNGFVRIADFTDVYDDMIVNYQDIYLQLIEKSALFGEAGIFYRPFPNKDAVPMDNAGRTVPGQIAVYTGIFGNYDGICKPDVCPPNIDYYFISDERPADIRPFRWLDGKAVIPDSITNPIKRNRYIKMHPHKLFPQYKYSVYMDGNITLIDDISGFVHCNASGISVFMLPWRDCIYYEALATVSDRRVVTGDVCRQVKKYLKEGMPLHYGLPEMPVIAREHSKLQCIKVMEDWWQEFDSGAQRDQLSFMYAMWKNGMKLTDLTSLGADVRKSKYLYKTNHFARSKEIRNMTD